MRLSLSYVFAAAALSALAATACSAAPSSLPQGNDDEEVTSNKGTSTSKNGTDPKDGTSSSGGSSSGGSSSGGSSSGGSSSGGSSSGGSSSGSTPDTAKCAAASDAEGCFTCCAPDPSVLEASGQAFDDCVCGASGVCKNECGSSYCKNPEQQPTAACEQCLAGASKCEQAAQTVCDGNAGCKAATACFEAAKCYDKN